MNQPMDVLTQFPVRKTGKQKHVFQEAVLSYASELGYEAQVEKGSFGVRNIVIGDPDRAKYLITAHYDTCAALPFPNLITPCSFWLFAGWQLLLVLILGIPAGVLGGVLGTVMDAPETSAMWAYCILLLELVWMLFGPANKHNANDNTSGVVTVLSLLSQLPETERSRVCFVLFDLEEGGLLGSAAYRSKHRQVSSHQIVLNLDCVGEGDEILLFPTKKMKQNTALMDRFETLCQSDGGKSIALRRTGFSVYPSDQANFPLGIGVASFCRSKWAGLYLSKIHTKNDKLLDEKNIAFLCKFLIQVTAE